MKSDPIKKDARHSRRKRLRLNRTCIVCGLSDPASLVITKRSLIEQHHLVGRVNEADLTVPLCRNHHAQLTAKYTDEGISMKPPETILHRLEVIARAIGVFFIYLGHHFKDWADSLAELIKGLDKTYPTWRAMPEAKPNDRK
jgi:hypothetical protein